MAIMMKLINLRQFEFTKLLVPPLSPKYNERMNVNAHAFKWQHSMPLMVKPSGDGTAERRIIRRWSAAYGTSLLKRSVDYGHISFECVCRNGHQQIQFSARKRNWMWYGQTTFAHTTSPHIQFIFVKHQFERICDAPNSCPDARQKGICKLWMPMFHSPLPPSLSLFFRPFLGARTVFFISFCDFLNNFEPLQLATTRRRRRHRRETKSEKCVRNDLSAESFTLHP